MTIGRFTTRVALSLGLAAVSGCGGTADDLDIASTAEAVLPGSPSLGQTITLNETSYYAPALSHVTYWSYNGSTPTGQLLLAWTGTDGRLNLGAWADYPPAPNGQLAYKLTTGETSSDGPSLTTLGFWPMIAWTGTGNQLVNLAEIRFSGGRPSELVNKVTLPNRSVGRPAIAFAPIHTFLAWQDPSKRVVVCYSPYYPFSPTSKIGLADLTDRPPALARGFIDGTAFLAWRGLGNNLVHVATITTLNGAFSGLTNHVTLGEQAQTAPAITTWDDKIFVAWGGIYGYQRIAYSADGGQTFAPATTLSVATSSGPALSEFPGWIDNILGRFTPTRLGTAWTPYDGTFRIKIAQLE